MARPAHILIIGAGAGGLAAASDLAHAGLRVTVLERAGQPGGKMRQVENGGVQIDAGPTVFTMRWVFEALFAAGGQSLDEAIRLHPAAILARHAWREGGRLDLFADRDRSADAIAAFSGPEDARAYTAFIAECAAIHDVLKPAFMSAERPSMTGLAARIGDPRALLRLHPFTTLWQRLSRHFRDPRLRQLFARYATYVGSSPFLAPATLMLIAHVEQEGVWIPEGGMLGLARAMQHLAEAGGAVFRFDTQAEEIVISGGRAKGVRLASGEDIPADIVLFNGDAAALASGLLGPDIRGAAGAVPRGARSLSAVTWCLRSRTRGFPLDYHNVFFAEDYRGEFDTIFRHRTISQAPTVYVCAADRQGGADPNGPERLLILINAPADGDQPGAAPADPAAAAASTETLLAACGLEIEGGLAPATVTTPTGFHALFPGTGGALYGAANHSPLESFRRPGAATGLPGFYLAGGSAHPGAGVPMATLSGRIAATRILKDLDLS